MRIVFILLFLAISSVVSAQKRELAAQVDSLIAYAKTGNVKAFADNVAYKGSDAKRKWEDVLVADDEEELKNARNTMNSLKGRLNRCGNFSFDTLTIQNDTYNGIVWYGYVVKCASGEKLVFSFVKISDKYALGDLDWIK